MSEHRKWLVYFTATVSVPVEVEAPDRDSAIDAAWDAFDGGPTPCHQCASAGLEPSDYDFTDDEWALEELES